MKVRACGLEFESVRGWECLPAGWSHPDVASVATDEAANVYLFCRGDWPVIVYDSAGRLLHSWGTGQFSYRTHGMFIVGGHLYLVDDGGNRVGEYTLNGTFVRAIGPVGAPSETGYTTPCSSDYAAAVGARAGTVQRSAGPYNRPTNLAVGPEGDFYVCDGYGNARVHRFSRDAALIGSWGEPGSEPGQLMTPHGVWAHSDGRVFVADRQNDRIQIFSAEGQFLEQWLDVQRPQDIFVDGDGLVYVAELAWLPGDVSARRGPISALAPGRVSVYAPNGELLLRWGDADPTSEGSFAAPHAIWVDRDGSIYVAEVTDTFAVRRGLAPPGTPTLQKFARI